MAKQICPQCGCYVGVDAYEKEGVLYCCEPCATGSECDCGCCTSVEKPEEKKKKKSK